jgi:hypothetical protein
LVVRDAAGALLGRGAAVVRGETLLLLDLDVAPEARGRGLGAALFSGLRQYGRNRGARGLECASARMNAALAFLLRQGIPARTSIARLEANMRPPLPAEAPLRAGAWSLSPIAIGPGLSGWVADLDRETRGFSRAQEWTHWLRTGAGEAWALKRRGRPEGIAALIRSGAEVALGPIEARDSAGVAAVLPFLLARAGRLGASRVSLTLPLEARGALDAAFASGFRLVSTNPFFAMRPRVDPKRYAGSGGIFY